MEQDADLQLIVNGVNIPESAKTKGAQVQPFVRADIFMYCEIATDPTVTLTEFRILTYVYGHMDSYNVFHQTLGQLQEALGITQAALSRNLHSMFRRGWLARCNYRGRSYDIMANPEMARRCKESSAPMIYQTWRQVLETQAQRNQGRHADDIEADTQRSRSKGKRLRQKTRIATIEGVDARDRQSKKKPDKVTR